MPDEIKSPVDTPVTPPTPQATAPEPEKSGAVDSGEGDKLPDWVKDPAKAYEEIKARRQEAADNRKEAANLKKRLDDLEKSRNEEEEKKLTDQQEWKRLAEKAAKERDDLKAELENERLNSLKSLIGQEFKLPSKLVARLQGATAEELRADAAELATELGLDKKTSEPEPPPQQPKPDDKQPARRPSTTTAVPGEQAAGRTDADRRVARESRTSPMFDVNNAGNAVARGPKLNKRTYP